MKDERWLRHLPTPGGKRTLSQMIDRNKERLGVLALVFLLIALGFTVYSLTSHSSDSTGAGAQRRIQYGSLRLRADRSGEQWKVSWNPQSVSLKHATRAELLIDDGPEHSAQLLSPAQILKGYAMYSPHNDDVVFQLQAFDSDENRTSGTVRLVRFGRDAQPSVVETCEEVSRPAKALPRTGGKSPDSPGSSSPIASADHLNPLARPIILNNESDVTPKQIQSAANSPETSNTPAPQGSVVRELPGEVQLPTESSDSSAAVPGRMRRVFQVFPKTGRKLMRLFRIKRRKPTSVNETADVRTPAGRRHTSVFVGRWN